MNFGEWLYSKRKEAGLTQGQLAEKAHISTSYVSTLERQQEHTVTGATPQPDREIVVSLAKVLKTDVSEALFAAGYAPKNAKVLPEELQLMDFNGFDDDDLKDIAEYIEFKRAKKDK